MRRFKKPDSESFVLCSERIVLECRCGERLVLLGLEKDWRSEKSTFRCECGAGLTLADRVEERSAEIGEILRGSIRILDV